MSDALRKALAELLTCDDLSLYGNCDGQRYTAARAAARAVLQQPLHPALNEPPVGSPEFHEWVNQTPAAQPVRAARIRQLRAWEIDALVRWQQPGIARVLKEAADMLAAPIPAPEADVQEPVHDFLCVSRVFKDMQAAGHEGYAHEDGWVLMATADAEKLKAAILAATQTLEAGTAALNTAPPDVQEPERTASAHWYWRDSTQEWVLELSYRIKDQLSSTERMTEEWLLAGKPDETAPPDVQEDAARCEGLIFALRAMLDVFEPDTDKQDYAVHLARVELDAARE